MKKSIILGCIMSMLTLAGIAQNNNSGNNQNTEQQVSGATYTCPMHPEVNSDKPGQCPKCGMNLEKKESTQYTCSMCPDVLSSVPGKCPKCGMEMVVKQAAAYSCPMHPEVTSDKPGKCPECGMKLVKNESQKHKMKMMAGCCK